MLFTLLIVIIALIGVLLAIVVLLQSGQGGGLAGVAAGGATRQILGARQAPDLLERATWTLAAIFIVLCLLTNFAIDSGEQQESIIQEGARQQGQTEQQAMPPAEGEQALPPAEGNQQQAPPPQQDGGGQ